MIFEKTAVNTGRQPELDLSRGFSALLLVLCHIGLYLGDASNHAVYTLADIIGSEPCAPVFMALMGAGIAYSRHHDGKSLFLRGISLFSGGYLLSVIRTLLPRLIFGNIDKWTSVSAFFVADILQFAGLTFLFFALLKKLKLPSWGILLLSLAMVFLGQIFIANPPEVQNRSLIYFLNLWIPITEWSCFPFLTWFFFPAFGLAFGEVLLRCRKKTLLYGILFPVSLCGVIYTDYQFYRFYPAYAENYYFGGNFYYMGVKNVLLTVSFVMFFFSFWYFTARILPKCVKRYLTFLSRNLTAFYVFSWIFISGAIHLSAKFSAAYNTAALVILMVFMIALCSAATCGYLFLKRKWIVRQASHYQ